MIDQSSFFYRSDTLVALPTDVKTQLIASGIFSYEGVKDLSTSYLVERYEQQGLESFIDDLAGNYALLIVDHRKQCIHIITDNFASRPTYVYWNNESNKFACADSIKAITSALQLTKLNWDKQIYKKETAYNANFESTFVKDIRRLNGGVYCTLDLKKGELETINYVENRKRQAIELPATSAGIVEAYRTAVEKSVADYLIGHDRALVTLSGGFDSSIVYALAAEKMDVAAASICTVTSLHNHEIDRARELTLKYNSDHLILPVGFGDKPFQQDWIRMVLSTESAHNNFESFLKSQLFTRANTEFGDYDLILSGLGSDQFNGGTTVLDYAFTGFNDSLSQFMQNMLRDKWRKYQENNFTNFFQFAFNFTVLDFRETLWPFEDDQWLKYVAGNGRSMQRNGVLLESKLAHANQFSIGLPFLDQSTHDLLHKIPEEFRDDLFYNKNILRLAFKDLLPDSFEGKPKFYRTKKAEEKIFGYMKSIIYGNNYGLLKQAYDASPELQSKFSIDKLIGFLEEVKTSKFFPAYTHVLSIISMGILDAYYFHDEDFSSQTDNSDCLFYKKDDTRFDREDLEKQVLFEPTETWDLPVKKVENITIYESQDKGKTAYVLAFGESEYIRIENANSILVLQEINGASSIAAICKKLGIDLAAVTEELQGLFDKKVLY